MNKAVIIVKKTSGFPNAAIQIGDKFRGVIDLDFPVDPMQVNHLRQLLKK